LIILGKIWDVHSLAHSAFLLYIMISTLSSVMNKWVQ